MTTCFDTLRPIYSAEVCVVLVLIVSLLLSYSVSRNLALFKDIPIVIAGIVRSRQLGFLLLPLLVASLLAIKREAAFF